MILGLWNCPSQGREFKMNNFTQIYVLVLTTVNVAILQASDLKLIFSEK